LATWKELGRENLIAAKELLATGHYRTSVSRGYYAVYASVSEELQGLATFVAGREGPSHDDLPDMLYDYLTRLSEHDRWLYSTIAGRMHERRVHADYRPSLTVGLPEAREQVSWAEAFIKLMEVAYG
jgi:uncharacterized protein (UPF0332 family)